MVAEGRSTSKRTLLSFPPRDDCVVSFPFRRFVPNHAKLVIWSFRNAPFSRGEDLHRHIACGSYPIERRRLEGSLTPSFKHCFLLAFCCRRRRFVLGALGRSPESVADSKPKPSRACESHPNSSRPSNFTPTTTTTKKVDKQRTRKKVKELTQRQAWIDPTLASCKADTSLFSFTPSLLLSLAVCPRSRAWERPAKPRRPLAYGCRHKRQRPSSTRRPPRRQRPAAPSRTTTTTTT